MNQNRPQGRQKNVTSGGNGVHKRGDGLGTGPVHSGGAGKSSSSGGGKRAAIGGGVGVPLIVIAYLVYKFLGSGGTALPDISNITNEATSSGNQNTGSSAQVNNMVASGSREKRTNILGNNQDTITIMVYMCGTDLESKNGMASSDINEMAAASFGENVNLIIYTGGCKEWKINGISSSKNQIYQIKSGKLECLEADMGTSAMTDPDNLAAFIQYCGEKFPANRNNLILWDHGGGSVSGYGYDEKNKSSGSMHLANISKALKKGGITFDFIGFDACLMATAETALMLNEYADYMIASEETEPGIGWYYTNWLTKLGQNTSMSTVDIGKMIVDDFIDTCAKKCRGQKTTLSVTDLAEFSNTIPQNLNSFAKSVSSLMEKQEFKTVSDARYASREFAQSSKIDQVDLVDLAERMNTSEGQNLSAAIKNAVKYNRTSYNMTNANGISIYFPYQRTSNVDAACSINNQIGMDSEYSHCIRQFASLETSGQVAAGGSSSPVESLLNGTVSIGSSGSSEFINQLLSGFLGSISDRDLNGLNSSNSEFMSDSPLSQQETADYLALNYFDTSNLIWEETAGEYKMVLPENQWSLVHMVDKNIFYDDGSGYVDLGLDNLYTFDSDGNLIADADRDWISVNNQPVAYYHTDTTTVNGEDVISGYIPAMLNGERANLIVVFDSSNPDGYIAGAQTDYHDNETDTVAKNMTELNVGDEIDFICDYYSYDGEYLDSYYLGDKMTVTENMKISNTDVGTGKIKIMYCFTDIYNNKYWSETILK